jgi:hypothetical protein
MIPFLPLTRSNEIHATSQQAHAIVHTYRQDLKTGVIQLSAGPDEQTLLLFHNGKVISSYLVTPDTWKRQQPSEWAAKLDADEMGIKTVELPIEGVHIVKFSIEQQGEIKKAAIRSGEVKTLIEEWNTAAETGLAAVLWSDAQATLVLPGSSKPIEILFFASRDQMATGLDGMRLLTTQPDEACIANYIPAQTTLDAWREYQLHRAFSEGMKAILTRYQELAGRSLLNALSQELSEATAGQEWAIQVSGTNVIDRQVFHSIEDAANAYRMLVNLCLADIETVVGTKFSNAIVEDAVRSLDGSSQDILKTYPLFLPGSSGD